MPRRPVAAPSASRGPRQRRTGGAHGSDRRRVLGQRGQAAQRWQDLDDRRSGRDSSGGDPAVGRTRARDEEVRLTMTTAGERSDELAEAGLDGQNRTALGRLLGTHGIGYAEKVSDGKMRATVRIPVDELCWEPGILILPHGGELELTLINHDKNTHCAVLPSNGDDQFIWLVRSEERRCRESVYDEGGALDARNKRRHDTSN